MKDKYKILQKYGIDTQSIISSNLHRPVLRGISIDNDNAFFLDDGINLTKRKNIYILQVSVTDVSECIEKDSILEKSASLTLCESDQAMLLPAQIKQHCLSLNLEKVNLSLTIELHIDNNLNVIKRTIYESVFINKCKYSYNEVDTILQSKTAIKDIRILRLSKLAEKLHCKRCVSYKTLDASDILKEIIILANSQIADFCSSNNIPIVYENKNPKCFNKYTVDKTTYTTFTSPMRKYLDLVVQSQLKSYLNAKNNNYSPKYLYSNYYLSELSDKLNKYNCSRNYNYAIKSEVHNALKQKETINNETVDKILHELEKNRVEPFIIFYIIFSPYTDNIIKEIFFNIIKKNLINEWPQAFFTFLNVRTNIYIYTESPNTHKRYIDSKFKKEKQSDKKNSVITIKINNESFIFYGKKRSSETLSTKAMQNILNRVYKYINNHNINIFNEHILFEDWVKTQSFIICKIITINIMKTI